MCVLQTNGMRADRQVGGEFLFMSVDVELWTRDGGALEPLLPRAREWEPFDGGFQFEGDDWLLSMYVPEPVDDGDVPPEIDRLVDGLAYRIELALEPSDVPPEAWALLRDVMESLGRGLGGAGLDPDSGVPTSWAA